MADLNFPDSPTLDQEYTANGRTWKWNGEVWESVTATNIDHGTLTGLADDDHTQYHNDTRGDARYYRENEHINTSAGAGDAGKPIVLDAAGHVDATMINNADIEAALYMDIQADATWITVDSSEQTTLTASMHFPDGVQTRWGSQDDLRAYHNGTNAVIQNDTGTFYILQNLNGGTLALQADDSTGVRRDTIKINGGANPYVTLMYGGNIVFYTTSTGVDITGDLDITDNLSITGSSASIDSVYNISAGYQIKAGGTRNSLNGAFQVMDSAGNLKGTLSTDGTDLYVGSSGGGVDLVLAHSGSTEVARIDVATDSLVIASGSNLSLPDSSHIYLGDSNDFDIYYDTNTSYIKASNNDLNISSTNGRIFLSAHGNGWGTQFNFYTASDITYATTLAEFEDHYATFAPTAGAGDFHFISLRPTINQTGTASGNYTGIYLNVTETAVLGTDNYLMDLNVGGVRKFAINNAGEINHDLTVNGDVWLDNGAANVYVGVADGTTNQGLVLRASSSTLTGVIDLTMTIRGGNYVDFAYGGNGFYGTDIHGGSYHQGWSGVIITNTGGQSGTNPLKLVSTTNGVEVSGDMYPVDNNVRDLGSDSLRYAQVHATTFYEAGSSLSTLYQAAGTYVTSVTGGTGISSTGGTTPSISHDAHTGDVTGSTALTIANDAVTYAKMQNVSATARVLGRNTAGAGDVEEITEAQFKALFNLEIGTDVQAYSTILQNTTASFLTAQETKLGHISVTQAVDLDAIETRVNELDAAVILMGTWAANAGTFPGSGSAQAGESWIVSTAGTVDGVAFAVDDRIIAITDNASTTVYAANWHKADYTDLVQSVNGQTGAVTLDADDIADGATNAIITLTQETNFETAYTHSQSDGSADHGLGTAAYENIGTSGANVPLLSTNNTWSGTNAFNEQVTITDTTLNTPLIITSSATNCQAQISTTFLNAWAGLDIISNGTGSSYIFFADELAERARIIVQNDDDFLVATTNTQQVRLSYSNSATNWNFQANSISNVDGITSSGAINFSVTGTDGMLFDIDNDTQTFTVRSHDQFSNIANAIVVDSAPLSVALYHDSTQRLITTTTGITVTGDIAVTGNVDGVDISALGTAAAPLWMTINANANWITVDSSERVLVGHTASISTGQESQIQLVGTTNATSQMSLSMFSVANADPTLAFMRSANATPGSHTIVADNDNVGDINWFVDDGVDYDTWVASLEVNVDDATPAAGAVGAEMLFRTATTAGAITTALTLDSSQNAIFGHTAAIATDGPVTLQLQVHDTAQTGIATFDWSAGTGNMNWYVMASSESGTIGSYLGAAAYMSNGSNLGKISWQGDVGNAGNTFDETAAIFAECSGAWSATDRPTSMAFYTTGTVASGLQVALTLDSSQNATFAGDVVITGTTQHTGNVGIGGAADGTIPFKVTGSATLDRVAYFVSQDANAFIAFADNSTTNSSAVMCGAIGNDFYLRSGGVEACRFDGTTQAATFAGDINIGGNTGGFYTTDYDGVYGAVSSLLFRKTGGVHTYITVNYEDNAGAKYITTDYAGAFGCNATGDWVILTAPSGTAGTTPTFTQHFTLQNSGTFLLGAHTPTTSSSIGTSVLGNLLLYAATGDDTAKYNSLHGVHFSLEEETLTMMSGASTSDTAAILRIGGGQTSHNAHSQIDFYTGTANVLTGTARARIDVNGIRSYFGLTVDGAIDQNGSTNNTFTSNIILTNTNSSYLEVSDGTTGADIIRAVRGTGVVALHHAGSDPTVSFYDGSSYAAIGMDATTNEFWISTGNRVLESGTIGLKVSSSTITSSLNHDFAAGIDVTGNITVTGTVDGIDLATNAAVKNASNTFTADQYCTGDFVAGSGSGSIALTVNDGYGNANLTFNHQNGTPDVTGSSGRIESSVDGATASFSFELGDSTTVSTPVALSQIMYMTTSLINAKVNLNAEAGLDVTGNITVTGTVDGVDINAHHLGTGTSVHGATSANTVNQIVCRDANGDFSGRYINGSYMNMSHAVGTRTTDTVFYSSTDNYIRKTNRKGMVNALNLRRIVELFITAPTGAVSTGNGKAYFHVPANMDNMNLVTAHAEVVTTGTTATIVQVHNLSNALDMLTTRITIDANENGSDTGTEGVVNTSNDHIDTHDIIRIDVDSAGTGAKGLFVTLEFEPQ